MNRLSRNREFWLFSCVVAMIVATALRAPGFAAPANLAGIFNDTAILIILALGQMAVLLTRSIDLSMASNLALSGMIVALTNAAFPEIPVVVLMLLATMCGLVLGAFNGQLRELLTRSGIPIDVTPGAVPTASATISAESASN